MDVLGRILFEFSLLILFIALVWGAFCAWLAGEKGRDRVSWFVLGFVFWPIALVALAGAPSLIPTKVEMADAPVSPLTDTRRAAHDASGLDGTDTRRCPDCAELVRADARICRYCGHEFKLDDPLVTGDLLSAARSDLGSWAVTDSSGRPIPTGDTVELQLDSRQLSIIGSSTSDAIPLSLVRANAVKASPSREVLWLHDGTTLAYILGPSERQEPWEVARAVNLASRSGARHQA